MYVYIYKLVINTQKKVGVKITHLRLITLSKMLNWKENQLDVSKTSFLIF